MFKFFKPKERLLESQIKAFIGWAVRHETIDGTYYYWLTQFAERFEGSDVDDITDEDEYKFLEDVAVIYGGEFQLKKATTAIKNFRKFYKTRGKNIEQRRPLSYSADMRHHPLTKTARNKELVLLRESDSKKWSWRALGEKFGIHFTTAKNIYTGQRKKYVVYTSYPQK